VMACSLEDFTDRIDSLCSVSGLVRLADYSAFWESLSTQPKNASHFVTILISKYVFYLSGQYKTCAFKEFLGRMSTNQGLLSSDVKLVPLESEFVDLVDSLYITIFYVSLFYRSPSTAELEATIGNWINYAERTRTKGFVVEYFIQLRDSDENHKYIWLVEQCFQIQSPPEDLLVNNRDLVAAGCIHHFLRTSILRDPHIAQIVYETIAMYLGHPNTTQNEILPLLHMFKQFLTLRPGVNRPIVSASFTLLQRKHYLWPKPYSDEAREILQLLTIEQKAAGNALRSLFFQEIPEIIDHPSGGINNRMVHVLCDNECPNSTPLIQLLEQYRELEGFSVLEAQMALLANIFDVELRIDPELLGVEYLSPQTIKESFNEALQILQEAVLMQEADAVTFKQQQLTALKDKMLANCTNSSTEGVLKTRFPRPPTFPLNIIKIDFTNYRRDVEPTLVGGMKFPRGLLRETMMDILDKFLPQKINKKKLPVFRLAIVGNDASLNKFTCCLASLHHSHNEILSQVDFRVYFIPVEKSNFADWLGRQDPWYGRNITCLMSGLCKTFPSIIQLCNPSVIEARLSTKKPLKPKTPESLSKKTGSSVILQSPPADRAKSTSTQNAQMDGALAEMQRRMALKPSSEQRASEHRASEHRAASGAHRTNTPPPPPAKRAGSFSARARDWSPSLTIREELNDFFRDAKTLVKVSVFNCECWNDDTLRSDLSFPFVQHVEIGLNAEIRALQFEEDAEMKQRALSAPVFSVKYSSVDFRGSQRNGISIPAKPYVSVLLSNIPSVGDERTSRASPLNPWLDVCMIEQDKKKKTTTQLHVNSVEFEASKHKLQILVDGQLHGPFYKIRIYRCKKSNNEDMYLPISSFLQMRDDL